MKKLFALLLVAVMCLSLVACGGTEGGSDNAGGDSGDGKFTLYQEWKNELLGTSIKFNKNGTAILYGAEYKYDYDKTEGTVAIHANITLNYRVKETDGVYKLVGPSTFVTVDHYEEAHAAAVKSMAKDSIGDATVISVGESHKFENGLEVKLNKIECTEKVSGTFKLHLTCKNTTGEEIELQTARAPIAYYFGNAFLGMAFDTTGSSVVDDSKIPANASKDIGMTVETKRDLEDDEYGYLLVGFAPDYRGSFDEFKGFYVDVIEDLVK